MSVALVDHPAIGGREAKEAMASDIPEYDIDPVKFAADPYPDLANLRRDRPVAFVPQLGAVLLTRLDDVVACERQIGVFSSDQPEGLMNRLMGQNMMRKDGKAHLVERREFFPAVSPNAVAGHWRAEFETETSLLLDSLSIHGRAELVADLAMPLAAEALRRITGLMDLETNEMDEVSQAMIDGIANYAGLPEVEDRCHKATARIDLAIDRMLENLDEVPPTSLLSGLLARGMPLAQARANIKLAISGGQNELRDALAGSVAALLSHSDQRKLLEVGRAEWRRALAEYLRWMSPIGMSPRRVTMAYTLHGAALQAQDRVFLMFGAANRDERHFCRPDRFEVTRDTKRSIPFGAGPHVCAGAWVARCLIADVALPAIFERLKGLRLDPEHEVSYRGWAFRGPEAVHCLWQVP